MADSNAAFRLFLAYTGPSDEDVTAPEVDVSAPYGQGAQLVGGVDLPDGADGPVDYEVPMGTVGAATGMLIRCRAGQEVYVRLDAGGGSVEGTLSSGTVTIPFPEVPGERLSVGRTSNGGSGDLSVARSGDDVIVNSRDDNGLTGDTSGVIVYNNAPIALPDGGVLALMLPSVPDNPVSNATVTTSDTQDGAGSIVTMVFGDPADD